MRAANSLQRASSIGLTRACFSSDARKSVRIVASVASRRPKQTRANFSGRRSPAQRWYKAGTTLRCARSPVAPKSTTMFGSGTRSMRRPERSGFALLRFGVAFFPARAMRRLRIVPPPSPAFPLFTPASPHVRRIDCATQRAPLRCTSPLDVIGTSSGARG